MNLFYLLIFIYLILGDGIKILIYFSLRQFLLDNISLYLFEL